MARVAVTMTRDLIVDGVLYKAGETVELPGVSAAVVLDRGAGVPVCASEEIQEQAPVEDVVGVLQIVDPAPEEKPAPRRRSRKAKDEDAQPEEPEGGESEAEDASEPATGEGQEI